MFAIPQPNNEPLELMVESFDELDDQQRQELAQILVDREILVNSNTIVEYVLQKADEGYLDTPFDRDDLENDIPTGHIYINREWVDITEEQREALETKYERLYEKAYEYQVCAETKLARMEVSIHDRVTKYADRVTKFEDTVNHYNDTYNELCSLKCEDYPEPLEWWCVTSWFARKLAEAGELVLDGQYWGRTCSGQAITLDYVIQKLAFVIYAREMSDDEIEPI